MFAVVLGQLWLHIHTSNVTFGAWRLVSSDACPVFSGRICLVGAVCQGVRVSLSGFVLGSAGVGVRVVSVLVAKTCGVVAG